MPGASHVETTFADNITITASRIRTGPSTLDWVVSLSAVIVDAAGNPLTNLSGVDLSTLLNGGNFTALKTHFTNAVAQAATNKGITANS